MKPKYKMPYAHNDGRTAELELCYFCKKAVDLRCLEKCKHYSEDYEDNQCAAFVRVDSSTERILEVLDIKCGKPQS